MRWPTRLLVGAGLLGGAGYLYAQRRETRRAGATIRLSADAFNALQDQTFLSEVFSAPGLPWRTEGEKVADDNPPARKFGLTLYRLKGCPYCAKVEWLLRFHSVAFDVVDIDTLSGYGIPDQRYTQVPQIRLRSLPEADTQSSGGTADAYVVDSQHIVTALSEPLGFAKQLDDPRVAETRKWIAERFQAVSFLAANSTWKNARLTCHLVTPPCYHNALFRVAGGSVLFALARYKIAPSLESKRLPTDTAPPMELLWENPGEWLNAELGAFVTRLPKTRDAFHGGREPDLADVEMYAVTRLIDAHPSLRSMLHTGALGKWNDAMDAEMRRRMMVHVGKQPFDH
uniref:Glutaredoxin domain-containing protein n=1 Tax=Trypanosoma congolense (strain IL3000) TaxID=1068625 RepID=G0UPA2_TRYCI|nr:conserved hypothetical protein [Trypanosoma congolense IL3000]